MITFIKAQAASFFASMVDYFITIFTKEVFGFWYVVATALGTLLGGITNFSLGRRWVFKKREKPRQQQMVKYLIVWIGYLFLATSGVYLMTHYTGINYIYSKVSVTLFLAIAYNYPLQKKFVFR